MTLSRADVSRLLSEHGLAPRRAFGQNFVVDPNTVRRIARLAQIGPGDYVLEIGAGLGSLTLALAETGAHIHAIEIDNGIVEVLRSVVAGKENVRVIHGDALTLDWRPLVELSPHWHVVANLPYNVATPLVADLLDRVPEVQHMLVMVQREVAERFVATPRTPAYGAVSVKIGYWAEAHIVGDVPATVFFPKPKVASALVDIRRRPTPAVSGVVASELFALVRAGFSQRRKMLRRVLSDLVPPEVFTIADVSPESRAEELDLAAWGRLCAALHRKQ
ncbi:MAG: 16S rRNA (adenine(1518)-N(6)/adenine(1519)-N(6))-dimethyltransferase RsmA [Ilumatobacteraceae bacterium]